MDEQVNHELTAGAFCDMVAEIENKKRFPFYKKTSTLAGALQYVELTMKTFCNAKASIEPIHEEIFKYRITVTCKDED